MVSALIVVFSIALLLSFIEKYIGVYKWGIFVVFGIILISIATFKTVGNDDDSENYEMMFEHYDDTFITLSVEYSFLLISEFLNSISHDVVILFLFYTTISICIKFVAISQLTTNIFLTLVIFLSHFFILHDMIEIRVSVSAAFFLLAIRPICNKERLKAFFFLAIAVFFHYSALVLLPLLWFNNNPLSNRTKYILMSIVPLGYVLYFLHIDVLTTIPIPYIGDKLELYAELKDLGKFDEILIFKNILLLILILSFSMLIIYVDTVYEYNKYIPLLLKIMGVSFACFFLFSSLPVLSGRLYELFGVVDIITIPCLIYLIRPQYIAISFVCLLGIIMIYMDVFVYNLIR